MKKSVKLFTALTCVTLASGLIFPAIDNVKAEEPPFDYETTVESYQFETIQSSYVMGEDTEAITIPQTIRIGGGEVNAKATVYDPSNKVVELDENKFIPTKIGDYRVVYTLEVNEKDVVVCEKIIKVTKSGFYFEFPTNTNRIIPTEMNINISDKISGQGFDGTILLPEPDVYSGKTGEKVESPVIEISVQRPEGSSAEIVNGEQKTFKPDVKGEYIFTYSYTVGSTKVVQKQFSLNVNDTYNNEYELEYSLDSTKPTTAVLGVETKLPTVSGKNKATGEKVDVYYSISITKNGVDKSSMLNGNAFTATEKGDYVVTYTIKNVFGTKADSFSFTLKDVKDSKAPVVYAGKLDGEEIIDLSHKIPDNAPMSNIVIPAIYATDNSGDEITYKRQIYRTKTTTLDEGTIGSDNSKKSIILNYDQSTFADQANIANYIIFNYFDNALNTNGKQEAFTAGVYTIAYVAKDSSNLDATRSFTMELKEDFAISTPVIDFETILPTEIKIGEVVSFKVPTATDENDERMVVETYYRYNSTGDWIKCIESISGNYEIYTETSGTLNIKVEVENDYGVKNTPFEKSINVIDATDSEIPSFAEIDITSSNINEINDQFTEISLPTVTFSDNNVKYLSVALIVSDKDGNKVNVYDKQFNIDEDAGKLEVSGAKFKASKSGQYTVSYVVTDIADNTLIYSFKTNSVRTTVAPTIVKPIFDKSIQELELGESLILPIPTVKNGDGELEENPEYQIKVVSAEGDYMPIIGNKFKALSTGKYVIKYVVTASGIDVESSQYTINVVNSKAPTITTELDEYITLAKGASYQIPELTVDTNGVNDIDWDNSKIEVLFDGTVYRTLNYKSQNTDYVYTFIKDGTYTIKYTAFDLVGNSNTKSFTVKVGDTEKPVLTIDDSIDFSDKIIGGKLVINPEKLSVSDNSYTDINLFNDLKIEVKNTSTGKTISNNFTNQTEIEGYEYNLDEVGEYSVTFTLTDKAGNTTSVVKEFAVTANDGKKEFPTEVIGIILLVLACLILGGVVAYFIISRKKAMNPDKLKKDKEKKEKKTK